MFYMYTRFGDKPGFGTGEEDIKRHPPVDFPTVLQAHFELGYDFERR